MVLEVDGFFSLPALEEVRDIIAKADESFPAHSWEAVMAEIPPELAFLAIHQTATRIERERSTQDVGAVRTALETSEDAALHTIRLDGAAYKPKPKPNSPGLLAINYKPHDFMDQPTAERSTRQGEEHAARRSGRLALFWAALLPQSDARPTTDILRLLMREDRSKALWMTDTTAGIYVASDESSRILPFSIERQADSPPQVPQYAARLLTDVQADGIVNQLRRGAYTLARTSPGELSVSRFYPKYFDPLARDTLIRQEKLEQLRALAAAGRPPRKRGRRGGRPGGRAS